MKQVMDQVAVVKKRTRTRKAKRKAKVKTKATAKVVAKAMVRMVRFYLLIRKYCKGKSIRKQKSKKK